MCYVTVDRNGNEIYRGEDWHIACAKAAESEPPGVIHTEGKLI